MQNLINLFKNFGPTRLAAMGIVTAGLIVFFIFLMIRISTPNLAPLYSDLEAQDAAAIVSKLESLNIPFEVSTDSTQIKVPQKDIGRIRMLMAQDGLPSGGSMGYEIFDKQDTLGTTQFVQNINHIRALEGELARTIATLRPIQTARVHLVLPRRELFSRDKQSASASIFIKSRQGARLNREQIAAIQHLVAAAIPDLTIGNISIIDSKGNLLARSGDNETAGVSATEAKEQTLTFETRLRQNIENLIGRIVGYDKVRAEVYADLDFDHVTTNTETYDPDGQVVRSQQTSEESGESISQSAAQGVSVANNLPGANPGGANGQNSDKNTRTEETINYEINRTVTNRIKEIGEIKQLSVAVLVDGSYNASPDGTIKYVPRSQEELDKIEALVASAVGLNRDRGDSIEVINMRFTEANTEFESPLSNLILGLPQADFIRITELSILGIIAMLVILLVVRPIIAKLLTASEPIRPALAVGTTDEALRIQDQGESNPHSQETTNKTAIEHKTTTIDSDIEQMININQVEGKVRASSVKKVGDIVEKHPDETTALIRSWLYEEK